jgi:hypothetical protein
MRTDEARQTDCVQAFAGKALPFEVSGRILYCSRALWDAMEGPKPQPLQFESDGCSGGAPDVYRTWLGKAYKLWPACFIHDYHYRYPVLASGAPGRKVADDTLRTNIKRMVRHQGGSKWTAKRIAWLYWGRVRVWGVDSYQNWDADDKPLKFTARVREAWTRG